MPKKNRGYFNFAFLSAGAAVDEVAPEPGQRLRLSARWLSMALPAQGVEVELGEQRLRIQEELRSDGLVDQASPDLIVSNPAAGPEQIAFTLRVMPGESLQVGRGTAHQKLLFDAPREALRRSFELQYDGGRLALRDPVSELGTFVTGLDEGAGSAEAVVRRRRAIAEVVELYGGPLRPLQAEQASATLGQVNDLLRQEKFRPKDDAGRPGGLLDLPDDIAPVIVGDLHANVDNLLTILSENAFLHGLEAGSAAMIFLGDLVQPDIEPYDEMGTSVLTMDLLFKLKVKYPDRVFFLRGNHDSFSPEVSKDLVPQALLWRRTLEDLRGKKYRKMMEKFYDACPVVAVSSSFAACHAGPPRSKTTLEKIVNIRDHPGLLHDLTWNRVRRPGHPSGYTASDVRRFRKSLKLDSRVPLLVSHTPYSDQGTVWCDVGGIENHHVLYSSRPGYVSVFIGVKGKVAPQVYRSQGLLEWSRRLDGESPPRQGEANRPDS